jgi:hypothetical protein
MGWHANAIGWRVVTFSSRFSHAGAAGGGDREEKAGRAIRGGRQRGVALRRSSLNFFIIISLIGVGYSHSPKGVVI